jgi:Arc/MetJ family transcription regulator
VVASVAVATQKRSISFDESVLQEAEQRLAASGGSLSAFVNAALLHELQLARGRELLAEDQVRLGAVSREVEARVLAEWPA